MAESATELHYLPTISLREDERNPGHVRVSVFVGRQPGSRGHAGQIVLRTDEWDDLVRLMRGEGDLTTYFRAIVREHPDLPFIPEPVA